MSVPWADDLEPNDWSIGTGERLIPWMNALAQRLAHVVVLNRSWESSLTFKTLGYSPKASEVGIFMDPPYLVEGRSANLYEGDTVENNPARESYEWAVANGEKYRIGYCCHEGDFPLPEGWTAVTRTFSGINRADRFQSKRDLVMFSPPCLAGDGSGEVLEVGPEVPIQVSIEVEPEVPVQGYLGGSVVASYY